ncbi:class B sortase [Clostridiaceae bacterium Marseille-Q4145]|nr:class B sortase [Clostridiaceae bacterium Marseille-Q4145]
MDKYRMLKKMVRLLDRVEDFIGLLACLILFLTGLYAMVDSYLVYQHANDDSLLKFKPGYEGEVAEQPIQGNMVAWLIVDDTTIDYPVMQGETNEEYLNKDPYGNYSMSGSIFLDSRNAGDFTDDYSLIYGHHMEGDYMFGPLHYFLEQDFLDTHRTGELVVGDVIYEITFFAALEASATQELIFNPTEHPAENVLDYVKDHAQSCENETGEGTLIALSTCKYPDSVDRVLLFGYMKEKMP